MNITVKGRIASKLLLDFREIDLIVERIDGEKRESNNYSDLEVDLSKLTRSEVEKLRDVLKTCGIQGTRAIAADVTKFLKAADGGVESVTARTVRQAAWMLEHYVAGLPHHLVFCKDDYEGGSYVGYFVEDVDYVPEDRRNREREHVRLNLVHIENDSRQADLVNIYSEDALHLGPVEILKKVGYEVETPTLVDRLRVETEAYYRVREEIGKKYVARGYGVADLDDEVGGYSRSFHSGKIRLDNFGLKTPVVIDVLKEGDSEDRGSRRGGCSVNLYRWHPWNLRFFSPSEDDLARHLEADEDTEFHPEIQLPVHPLVPCFDLRRHVRLRAHVNNLTEYVYRAEVAAGLIIPERDRKLVDLLVDQSANTFEDVVEGKGQSMNVLSGGPPGTGKTLTVEVFAEFKRRPLYNVQCSQLGLDPESIEKKLGVVLRRANRWNAILLLDEADVYIRERGDDLEHNAIVGVFLRVLEYASCILFLTTNLPDKVDDAIASRCVVALHYGIPSTVDQARIWRYLADLNKIAISDADIQTFVRNHPRVSGRDVKNLLKLASFVAAKEGKPVDVPALEFALSYKATADLHGVSEGAR